MSQNQSMLAGALLAIKSGVVQALTGTVETLKAGGANPRTAAAAARARWQEAHAALRVVDHKGMVRFSEEIGAFITGAPDTMSSADRANLARHGCDALLKYMDEVAAGQPDRPLRLFPAYRELLKGRGVEQASEGDLYFPDITQAPPDRAGATALPVDELRVLRRRLEMGLLQWLRKPDDSTGLREIHAVLEKVEASQATGHERALWWAAQALTEAMLHGGLPPDNRIRRLFSQINLQLGKIIQGAGDATEVLLREALYHAARAKAVTALVKDVQDTYRLHGTLDAGDANASDAVLETLAKARERLAGMNEAWSACAFGEGNITGFRTQLRELSSVCTDLGNVGLDALLKQFDVNVSLIAADSNKLTDVVALEGACALLMIGNGLDRNILVSAGFPGRARNMAARLAASLDNPQALKTLPPAELQDEELRRSESRQLTQQVHSEAGAALRKVEEILDNYFRDTANIQALKAVDKPLAQSAGALTMLGETQAVALLQQCRTDIAGYVSGKAATADDHALLAKRLTVLSAYIEAARQGPANLQSIMEQAGLAKPATPEARHEVIESLDAPVAAIEPAIAAQQAPLVEAPTPVPVVAASINADGGVDTDPEMLEIFLEEAAEVLSGIDATLSVSRSDPQNQEHLTALRRAFHTLKGSGRMVGLTHFGEAAWEIEQVFNALAQNKEAGSPDLYRLTGYATECFSHWVSELKGSGRANIDAAQLTDWAQKVRAGQPLPEPQALVELPAAQAEVPAAQIEPPAPAVHVEPEDVVIGDVRVGPALFEIYIGEVRQHSEVLRQQNANMQATGMMFEPEFLKSAHTLAGISGTVGFKPVQELASSLERALQTATDLREVPNVMDRDVLGRAVTALSEMVEAIAARTPPAGNPYLVAALEAIVTRNSEAIAVLQKAEPQSLGLTAILRPGSAPMAVAETQQPASAAVPPAELSGAERRRYRLDDDVDEQLLPIFLAEAQELVPQVGQDLRDWRARPDDKLVPESLKRLLHTLKGSARMAGAMGLGELTHQMETRVENALLLPALPDSHFDQLEASFDRIGILFEQLQGVEQASFTPAAEPVPDVIDAMTQTVRSATGFDLQPLPQPVDVQPAVMPDAVEIVSAPLLSLPPVAVPTPDPVPRSALLRVRADMVDRLSNQVGEVSIARARIESEMRSLRASMKELTENVSRLRGQLREMEIQAETQMQSRMAQAQETRGDFDPLEFDRFTRLQELTRLMAESVNDVATLHQNLIKDLDDGEAALNAQARINREVQQELLAIRMMPFSSLNDRLYRVTRLAAKESAKRVNLDIKGGHVDLDRGMLDKITAPLEHMLRNSIVHGIEDPAQRIAAGKPESGEIVIEVRQEGNEVVLFLRDDGAGLNIERIREKAVARGLMGADETLPDRQIGEFIFHSGLSTAEYVSEVAGRGVGMDVVRSEITALGGRVEIDSERGKGARFTIFLPLTLAVLQAVVLRAGSDLYAVPALMVQQVQKVKPEVIAEIRAAGKVTWQDNEYPFRHLHKLLGLAGTPLENQRTVSLLLLRSGQYRCAIQVDDFIGGQEIVVKNIGPQLARVPGVTGAAVLGSGETVLILNPVILAQRWVEAPAAVAPVAVPAADSNAVQLATMTQAIAPPVPAAPPEPVRERQRTIMVVDDSLTVRKITGRLLGREGYIVIAAKDGIEALEKLGDALPDVVITDVEMPRMDGFDLTRNIRNDARLQNLPIIMITSRTADKHREHATQLGVNVFLGKPYEESELLRNIAELMKAQTGA
jgi:chemosensory pili system protein ChpA (sensor histidine kinase/response regulator)